MAIKIRRELNRPLYDPKYEPGNADMTFEEYDTLSRFPLVNQYPHYAYARARGQTWPLTGVPSTTKLLDETVNYKMIKYAAIGVAGVAAFVLITSKLKK